MPLTLKKTEEILKMEAGPELDALVAEKVMGWTKWNIRNGICYSDKWTDNARDCWESFSPSTDITAAWEVVEKWRDPNNKGGYGELGLRCEGDPDKGCWVCNFGIVGEGLAPTAPLAICRAALMSVLKKNFIDNNRLEV